jgi:hypothetical protein
LQHIFFVGYFRDATRSHLFAVSNLVHLITYPATKQLHEQDATKKKQGESLERDDNDRVNTATISQPY